MFNISWEDLGMNGLRPEPDMSPNLQLWSVFRCPQSGRVVEQNNEASILRCSVVGKCQESVKKVDM